MHTILVTLIRKFDFSLPDNGQEIRSFRKLTATSPMVVGEEDKGLQLPLKVSLLRNE